MDEITYEEIKDLKMMIDQVIRDYNRLVNNLKTVNDCLRPIMLKIHKEELNVEHE